MLFLLKYFKKFLGLIFLQKLILILIMNNRIARLGLYFYIINLVLILIFPKLFGNIFYIFSYLFICIVIIFFIYYKKYIQFDNIIMENYFIPFFLTMIHFRFKELRIAFKNKKMITWEIIHLSLTVIFSILLYLFIKQI